MPKRYRKKHDEFFAAQWDGKLSTLTDCGLEITGKGIDSHGLFITVKVRSCCERVMRFQDWIVWDHYGATVVPGTRFDSIYEESPDP